MDDPAAHLVHGTCVAIDSGEGPRGILLRGPSGAGKSDLALRLIDQGARLVADDQCALVRIGDGPDAAVVVRPPAAIAGALEVRGVGLRDVPSLTEAPLALIVDLVDAAAVERLPEDAREKVLGVTVPRLALDPFAVSTPAKLRLALRSGAAALPRRDAAEQPAKASGRGGRRVVVVTGLSGAGRSTALNVLEDLGYESVDNLPLGLLDALVGVGDTGGPVAGPVAVGVDIRSRSFAAAPFLDRLDHLEAAPGLAVTLLFLDCADEVLERRFTETRRRHPLAQDRRVADGIAAERPLVEPLRARADLVIDTSALTAAELRRILSGHFDLERTPAMTIYVTSFSYRHGLPREADLVFDVRFLANPHYVAELRELDGRDARVDAYVAADPAFAAFFDRLTGMVAPLLPRYEQEGKSYLTIALGCTGGRHRSVAIAERLAAWLAAHGREVHKNHRDVARADGGGAQRA